jgi:hypothetical protein
LSVRLPNCREIRRRSIRIVPVYES